MDQNPTTAPELDEVVPVDDAPVETDVDETEVQPVDETPVDKLKEAYGDRFSQIDVSDTNTTARQLRTDHTKEKELAEIKPALPRAQRKVKFSK